MIKSIIKNITELKKPCVEIKDYKELTSIIIDLEDTLKTSRGGIGLSANQIGYNQRVAIIRLPLLSLNLINPIILDKKDKRIFKEGCLSFPNIEMVTDRYYYIKIKNNDKILEFTGIEAIAVQHEIDHLNGLTIFDRKHKKR
jgi:peptide deformylase